MTGFVVSGPRPDVVDERQTLRPQTPELDERPLGIFGAALLPVHTESNPCMFSATCVGYEH